MTIVRYALFQFLLWICFMVPMISIAFEEPLQRYLSLFSTYFRWFYPSSWLPFFAIMCRLASCGLESIGSEMSRMINSDNIIRVASSGDSQVVVILLTRWKKQIALIGHYVNQLIASFGLLLMFEVPYCFIGLTTHLFYLNSGYHMMPWNLNVLVFLFSWKFFGEFVLLCFSTERIHREVYQIFL